MQKHNKNLTLLLFFPYLQKYKKDIFLALSATVLAVLCELFFPMIVRFITNSSLNKDALTNELLFQVALFYMFLRIIDALANYFKLFIGSVLGAKIERDMRKDLFKHLEFQSHSYYDDTKIGQLMARFTSDISEISKFVYICPEETLVAFLKIIFPFIVLSSVNLYLTLIIFSVIPFMALCIVQANKKMKSVVKRAKIELGELNAQVEDNLLGIRVIKSFTNEEMELQKFDKSNKKYFNTQKKISHKLSLFRSYTRIYEAIMYVTTVIVGAIFLKKSLINSADYTVFLLYISILLSAIRTILQFTEQFQQGIAGMERFFDIMEDTVTIKDRSMAKSLIDIKGDIEFRNVTFSYSDNNNILNNISFKINRGENIAIVGTSGSGKTTLCNLIPHFYDISKGKIIIDGYDVCDIALKSLRQNIGMVQQDIYMFSGTILENIEYGHPGSSRAEIEAAAKQAGAHAFITQLPQGYDTYVGERGMKLSGGQKQRISIARVFLKNPPILILDEATSALDNESEAIIQKSLEKLTKGRTSITIAHRLTTIQNADRILVLTQNGIEEEGTHQSLMDLKGIYYSLYKIGQQKSY